MRVVVLFGDRRDRARLTASLAGTASVVTVDQLADARRALRAPGTIAALVCVHVAESASALAAVRDLRGRFPALALIVYCDLHGLARRTLVALIRAGASDVIFRGVDDGRAVVLDAVAGAARHTHAHEIRERLSGSVCGELRTYFAFGLQTPQAADDLDAAAASLGLSRRTLSRRFAALGAPTPRRFFRWTRLLLAAALLRERGRTLPSVAHELHFESASALRLQLRRYAGVGVTSASRGEASRASVFAQVWGAFARAIGGEAPAPEGGTPPARMTPAPTATTPSPRVPPPNASASPSSGQGSGIDDTSR
jgi:AraC-like DNA-binding protein